MKYKNISVVIPTFNEKENIQDTISSLINSLEKNKINYEIIIVDDGSIDGTIEIVKRLTETNENIRLIIRNKKSSFGYSLIDGTRSAKNDIIIWMMGDNSDDPESIVEMLRKMNKGFDIVFGSRYMKGGSKGDLDFFKAFGSRAHTFIAAIIFGFKVHDINNAFRAFRKDIFNKIKLENKSFAISLEFAIKAHLKGFRLAEIPTTYRKRRAGQPKMNLIKMGFLYYYLLLKYKFLH